MIKMKKITVEVPADTLAAAQGFTKGSIVETVRRGLQELAARQAQRRLLAMKGKVKFDYTIEQIKAERE
jgi:hypothetical protein